MVLLLALDLYELYQNTKLNNKLHFPILKYKVFLAKKKSQIKLNVCFLGFRVILLPLRLKLFLLLLSLRVF